MDGIRNHLLLGQFGQEGVDLLQERREALLALVLHVQTVNILLCLEE